MTRKVKFLLMFLIAGMAFALVSCKPITYYLQQVDKAYGKVTEAGTGVPLESVEVSLGSYQYSELTNGLGDYELELAEGTWTLNFVKDGYVTTSKVVTVGPSHPKVQADMQLQKIEPEYYLSFKYNDKAITFTAGMVGAAVETGWGHDGVTYDRTHIVASSAGLSPGSQPDFEITLVGAPGSQPPTGSFTFSDGVHEIHDISYSGWGLFSKSGPLPNAAATVVVTKAERVGGIIEGTFSATLVDPNSNTTHSISDGKFHVQRFPDMPSQ